MKILNKKYIVVLLLLTMFTAKSNAQILKAEIRALGLTCSMCSNAINKQLESLPDVKSIDIDLNTNTFIVTLSDSNSLLPSVFKDKVENAGFFIGSLILTVSSETVFKSPYIIIKDSVGQQKQVEIEVLDKGYVTAKRFKKVSKLYKNVETFNENNENDFHVLIINE
jgi:copper chaperone CopZ